MTPASSWLGNMRKANVRVVAHPAVPIAAADAGSLDLDDYAAWSWRRVTDVDAIEGATECFE